MPDQEYPPVRFYFSLGFSDDSAAAEASFQEVSGLVAESGADATGEGGQNRYQCPVPATSNYGNLVLKRGLLPKSVALAAWVRTTLCSNLSEPIQPKQVLLKLRNGQGQPLAFWSFENTWPVKWSVSDFNAQEGIIAIETLELSYTTFQQRRV